MLSIHHFVGASSKILLAEQWTLLISPFLSWVYFKIFPIDTVFQRCWPSQWRQWQFFSMIGKVLSMQFFLLDVLLVVPCFSSLSLPARADCIVATEGFRSLFVRDHTMPLFFYHHGVLVVSYCFSASRLGKYISFRSFLSVRSRVHWLLAVYLYLPTYAKGI